jgi:aminoglycoside phosphotransferase (APT) family kinase protein
VPKVKLVLQERHSIGPGYIMSRLEGETIPRKILRDEQFASALPGLATQCGQALAGIHGLNAEGVAQLPHLPLQTQIEQYQAIYDEFGDPHPVFEIAFQWLRKNGKDTDQKKLVHGDFRHGNIMVGSDGLRAVLDWEMAHTGDPMEDLGWICVNSWRFGCSEKPVGGFGEREELFAGYEAGGGRVDPNRVHLWEVFGTLKWGIICILMVGAFRGGPDRSIERATIGRRASETEIDLLNLLLE